MPVAGGGAPPPPPPRRSLGLAESAEVVLAVQSAFNPDKRLDVLVAAMAGVRARRPQAVLVVVGHDDTAGAHRLQQLKASAALHGVGDAVRFVGQQPHHAIPVYMAAADVFVDPRASSSFSSCAVEAAWAGVPLVLSEASAASGSVDREMVAAVVAVDDAGGFAESVATLLGDAERRRETAAAGVEWARRNQQRTNLDDVARRHLRVYSTASERMTR